MAKKSGTGNLGKPLPASKVTGLLRAFVSLSATPPGRGPRRTAGAANTRVWTRDDIADLAGRILTRASDGKEVRLSPPTAQLVADALIRMNAAPTREQLAELICGSKACEFRADNHHRFCFECNGKATALLQLLRVERELDVG